MELKYLYEFMTLAKYKNFHAAADALNISQSTLTNHIKALEAEFKATLFVRNTRRVELSDYGRVFYPYAESFTQMYENCVDALNTKRHIDKVILTVALEPHYMVGRILQIFNNFKKEYENIVIEFINATEAKSHQLLRSGRCDIAIAPQENMTDAEFKTMNIRTERAVALMRKDHPFAEKQILRIEELRNEDLFLPPERLIMYRLLSSACREYGFTPKIRGSGVSELMGMILAKQGLGVSILSDYAAEKIADDSVKILEITPSLKWYVNLLYSGVRPNRYAQIFLDYIFDAINSTKEAQLQQSE